MYEDIKTIIELSFELTSEQKQMVQAVIPIICNNEFKDVNVYVASEYFKQSDFSSTIAQDYIKEYTLDSIDWKDH